MTVPARIGWAVQHLAARPNSHVLEIGCGAGHALALILGSMATGSVTGLDRSGTQLARAQSRHADAIASGRMVLVHDSLERAKLPRRYGQVLAVNVNAFWTAPVRSLPPLARCLAPDGRLLLVYEPPSATKLRALAERIPELLAEHGFVGVSATTERLGRSHVLGISAQLGAGAPPARSDR